MVISSSQFFSFYREFTDPSLFGSASESGSLQCFQCCELGMLSDGCCGSRAGLRLNGCDSHPSSVHSLNPRCVLGTVSIFSSLSSPLSTSRHFTSLQSSSAVVSRLSHLDFREQTSSSVDHYTVLVVLNIESTFTGCTLSQSYVFSFFAQHSLDVFFSSFLRILFHFFFFSFRRLSERTSESTVGAEGLRHPCPRLVVPCNGSDPSRLYPWET